MPRYDHTKTEEALECTVFGGVGMLIGVHRLGADARKPDADVLTGPGKLL
jgi:hypothetical protein